jgi:hypothetical protein
MLVIYFTGLEIGHDDKEKAYRQNSIAERIFCLSC